MHSSSRPCAQGLACSDQVWHPNVTLSSKLISGLIHWWLFPPWSNNFPKATPMIVWKFGKHLDMNHNIHGSLLWNVKCVSYVSICLLTFLLGKEAIGWAEEGQGQGLPRSESQHKCCCARRKGRDTTSNKGQWIAFCGLGESTRALSPPTAASTCQFYLRIDLQVQDGPSSDISDEASNPKSIVKSHFVKNICPTLNEWAWWVKKTVHKATYRPGLRLWHVGEIEPTALYWEVLGCPHMFCLGSKKWKWIIQLLLEGTVQKLPIFLCVLVPLKIKSFVITILAI